MSTATLRPSILALGFSVLAAATTLVSGSAFGLGVLATAGYETIKDTTNNPNAFVLGGLGGAALLQIDAFSLPLISFPVGAGLRYSKLSFSQSATLLGVTSKYESALDSTAAVIEAGVDVAAVPMLLHLQATASYDYMLSATGTSKITVTSGTSTGSSADTSRSPTSMSRTSLNGRAMLSVFPLTAIGIEGSYYIGKMELPKTLMNAAGTSKYNGAGVRALVSIGF